MENQNYIFTPMGDEPTKENLKKNFFKAIIIVAVCCAIASNFGRSDQQIYYLLAFILISLLVYLVRVNTKFIRHITIDPKKKILYLEYFRSNGHAGTTEFDLSRTRYSYNYVASKGYQGYVMKINDKGSKLEIRETKSENGKDQKNRFLKDQLDRMNQIIVQIRNVNFK